MNSIAYTIGTTRSIIVPADNVNRTIYLHVEGNGTIFLGGISVTSSNGLATQKHTTPIEFFIPAGETLYAIVADGTQEVRVLTPNVD